MTPDEWLADFETKTAELQRNAAAFRRNIESAGQTATSEDKVLTVTVAPNGALLDLEIKHNGELATKIMALVRQAREGAATTVLSEFGQVAGSHAGQLDTDVSAPELAKPEADDAPRFHGDEDFSSRSILR